MSDSDLTINAVITARDYGPADSAAARRMIGTRSPTLKCESCRRTIRKVRNAKPRVFKTPAWEGRIAWSCDRGNAASEFRVLCRGCNELRCQRDSAIHRDDDIGNHTGRWALPQMWRLLTLHTWDDDSQNRIAAFYLDARDLPTGRGPSVPWA